MAPILRVCIVAFCIVLFIYVIRLVSEGKLLLKYSLLWLALTAALLISAFFPDGIIFLSKVLGFVTAANFIFFIGLFCLMAIALSLSVIVSRQALRIKDLTQRIALDEYDSEKNDSDKF